MGYGGQNSVQGESLLPKSMGRFLTFLRLARFDVLSQWSNVVSNRETRGFCGEKLVDFCQNGVASYTYPGRCSTLKSLQWL